MNRRQFGKNLAAISTVAALPTIKAYSGKQKDILCNRIPSTSQSIPVIGMGTYRNLNVTPTPENIRSRSKLLKTFFELGGAMLDSSPMYGQSEAMIGECLKELNYPNSLFSTTKVWTSGQKSGVMQMNKSLNLWGLDAFDLMQIHNLVDWKTHLKTLQQWKEEKKIKYLGITTSHGRNHSELIEILKSHSLDFIQLTYNIKDREVENRILPLAADKGVAVIANRPFNGLFGFTRNKKLPAYAEEIGCRTWAQFYLKFVISHPAVTCAIPATSKIKHLKDNMQAGTGTLPSQKVRDKMIKTFNDYLA